MDGSETICLGESFGMGCRMYHRAGLAPVQELQKLSGRLASGAECAKEDILSWRAAVGARIGWENQDNNVWLLGQDAVCRLVVIVLLPSAEFWKDAAAAEDHVQYSRHKPLDEIQPWRAHGTACPIVQGQ
jgi:hypothetical protein